MTNKQKQLLLKDLSARLPYGVICKVTHKEDGRWKTEDMKLSGVFNDNSQQYFTCEEGSAYSNDFKPYLRPMSSITEEERKIYTEISSHLCGEIVAKTMIDWLNEHHFDYRGLIPMGLALEAPKDMYKTE